jgi:uncharacterized membrane protein YeaQ/YmgE (transglycosylase-associated protein family)
MDLLVTGVVAGVLGTLAMDSLNLLFARTGMLSKIDVGMIGRMAVGWARGRFRYEHPSEMEKVANEKLYGYLTHYTIGVGLAVPFVATTVASYFFGFPSMGFGVAGRRAPEGIRAPFSALANHLFYGVGIAVGIALV